MYTVSILMDQSLVRRDGLELSEALLYVHETLGQPLCAARVWADVHNGAGACVFICGVYVTIAKIH